MQKVVKYDQFGYSARKLVVKYDHGHQTMVILAELYVKVTIFVSLVTIFVKVTIFVTDLWACPAKSAGFAIPPSP